MIKFAIVLAALSIGCTQHNPAVCCNTPTQCADLALDQMYGCDPGKVCDPNGACVPPACATSAECSSPAPYCAIDGLCTAECTADTECPGGDQDSNLTHCMMGACAECATSNDCPLSAPVCASGACRLCQKNAECASQVCGEDGLCVAAADIAYANPTGTDTGNCELATPCSLAHAIGLGRQFTVASSGVYSQSGVLTIGGASSLIGVGASPPTITRSTPGPIMSIAINAHVHLENVQISGATNTSSTVIDGFGIQCPNDQNVRFLDLADVTVIGNMSVGIDASSCAVTAFRSLFKHNLGDGIYAKDHPFTADRCEFTENSRYGLEFDGAAPQVSNSFFTYNVLGAVLSSGFGAGGYFHFNTVAKNTSGTNFVQAGGTLDISNNLFAGNSNAPLTCDSSCVTSGNVILTSDITSAHFKSTTDFHITAGSIAIDAATASTVDHDFDGDMRPMGAARDVGADEAQ